MYLYDKYAIIRIHENTHLERKKNTIIKEKLKAHFGQNHFVLINDRKFRHEIDLSLYKEAQVKNLKGIAIVSADLQEKERALAEQELFDSSFAFFENLDDARAWASSFFW
jgi:uncharacterized HAD superfamily protein